MAAVIVVGAQWGDEGKGKIVDLLADEADVVVRFAGGPNAGHTLVVGNDKVVVRLVPSGILRPATTCVLGQGMVVDLARLVGEMDELRKRGHAQVERLKVSDKAHAILPYHVMVDTLRETGAHPLGTTKRGVGPAYEDKAARRGVQLGLLREPERLRRAITGAIEAWTPTIRAMGGEPPAAKDVLAELEPLAHRVMPLLTDTGKLVADAVAAGQRVLLEGAQGTLLDLDHGTYPYVTSSTSTAGGACTGAGVGPTRIDAVVGLVKAYCTRVGLGPFPTELGDANGERLRKVGNEFGSVTGRPRRTGWLDLPALRTAARINGLDALAITKLDVLTGLDEIKACVRYRSSAGEIDELPTHGVEALEPIYATLPGWHEDIGRVRSLAELPRAAANYIRFIEEATHVPAWIVSVGYRRDETVVVRSPWR